MTEDPQRWLTPEMKAFIAWSRNKGKHPEAAPVRLWPLRNDDRLGHWLERAYHAHAALLRDAVAELGVTPAQAALLLDIREAAGRWSQGYLARRLRISRSVVTRLVHRLVALGLVELGEAQRGRRTRSLAVSRAGEELLEEVERCLEDAERELVGQLRPSEARWLLRVLPRVETAARRARGGELPARLPGQAQVTRWS
jgi:DNA-binding MarR family transcriptional regulator